MFASWSSSSEPNIYFRQEVDCTNVLEFINKLPKENRPSVTHFGIKVLAEFLKASEQTMNGKIIWGKFIPFKTLDVSCLVDIEGGEDLATVLIEKCDTLCVKDIQQFLKDKANKIKKNKGDQDHKKRTGPIKMFPSLLIELISTIVSFLAYNLGIGLRPMGFKKNQFGAGCITSVGMLGIKDAFAPVVPFMRTPILLTLGQMFQKPIVKDNQIVIANVMNFNFTVDHRFIDGGKAKLAIPFAEKVMEHPELFYENSKLN